LKRWSIGPLFVLCIATMLTCSTAHATDVALTGDAHVSLTRPTTNFGSLANLYVGNGNTALLQFDLGGLPSAVTSSQVARATLTVFVNRVNAAGTVSLSPGTSTWNEPSVTYATIPSIASTSVASFPVVMPAQYPATPPAATAGQYVMLDVTSVVQNWLASPGTNFGLG
jgi:hypothetical protein